MRIPSSIKGYFASPDAFAELLRKVGRKRYLRHARKNHEKIHRTVFSMDFSNIEFDYFGKERDITIEPVCIEQAEKYLAGKYDILGSGELTIENIDWHKDYVSGTRWNPGSFFYDYKQESISSNSDVKWPRELSRCHQLLQVAVAYDMSGDKRYADFIISNIENWIVENPLMYSINWGCPMDVAIRAVNWIWALSIIDKSHKISPDVKQRILASLYEHGWFIYNNPEKMGRYNHNHYLADLSGQVQLGLLFKDTQDGKKWLDQGIKALYEEIRQQILPSGMSYERSVHYDRLVLELVLVPVLLLKRNEYEVPQDIWYRIQSMFDSLLYIIKPDGSAPIVGDQDNGRLLPFSNCELNDFRYLMSLGALLFSRADMKAAGNGYNTYCHYLLPEKTIKDFETITNISSSLESRAFSDAGFYIMRQKNNYLLFNASGKGLYPERCNTTHTHSDLLSIELVSEGETFLCDAGTGCYTGDAEKRMLFRSTRMHNTATVDDESQNVITKENLWDFERNAIPIVTEWMISQESDRVSGEHTGYLRLSDPVTHKRKVEFNKHDVKWQIDDLFEAQKEHLYKLYFHFAPEIEATIANKTIIAKGSRGSLRFTFKGTNVDEVSLTPSLISRSYGATVPSQQAVIKVKGKGNTRIITLIEKI